MHRTARRTPGLHCCLDVEPRSGRRWCDERHGMGTVLSESDIAEELAKLPGWERDGGLIRAQFRAANFLAAIALVDEVARRAEAANHHPDIDIRYDRVTFVLS